MKYKEKLKVQAPLSVAGPETRGKRTEQPELHISHRTHKGPIEHTKVPEMTYEIHKVAKAHQTNHNLGV